MPRKNDATAAQEIADDLPELLADRIVLRGYRASDLADLFALHSDPRVMRYWSFPAWTQLSQAQPRLDGAMAGRDANRLLCWAIAGRDDDRLIGGVTLYAINREQGRAEIGYALHPDRWGLGVAQGALRLVLAHAFGALGLRRVEADIDPRNEGSCNLVDRMGFVREGLLRERWLVAGEVCDSALYGLLARDWRQASAASGK